MGIFSKSVIGLELDSQEIRAAEIKGTPKKPVIVSLGKVRLPEGVVKEGCLVNPAQFGASLERLFSENSFKSREVIFGVNNQDVIVRFATFPKVPEDKIRSMIQFQAQDYIPVSLEELELDYIVVNEKKTDEGEFINVILVGARKRMLYDYIEAFNQAKVSLREIDSTMLAMGRAALLESNDGTFALVCFNHDIGNILIFKDGILGMARSVSISQIHESALSSGFNSEDKINMISDVLLSEIKASVSYFMMQNKQSIEKIFILGTNSSQERISSKLKEKTELNVKVLDSYRNIEKKFKANSNNYNSSEYIAAISLAIKGLGEK